MKQTIHDYAWIKEDFSEQKISSYDHQRQQWPFLSVRIGQKVEIIEQRIHSSPTTHLGDFCLVKTIQNELNDNHHQHQQLQEGLVPINILRFPLQKQQSLSSTSSSSINHQLQQPQQRPSIMSTMTTAQPTFESSSQSPTTTGEGKYSCRSCFFYYFSVIFTKVIFSIRILQTFSFFSLEKFVFSAILK